MQKQKYIQLFADALIPVLGFFFWHWNSYFIVLFYFIDAISGMVFSHIEAYKIEAVQKNSQKTWVIFGGLSTILLLISVLVTHLIMLKINPSIQFKQELIAFWQYEDMGFAQGYLLIPLILFAGYQRYKMEFLLPKMAERIPMKIHWKKTGIGLQRIGGSFITYLSANTIRGFYRNCLCFSANNWIKRCRIFAVKVG
jgi:hypothetical protein